MKEEKTIPPKKPKPTNKTVVMMKKVQLKVNCMGCGIVLHVHLMYTNLHLGPKGEECKQLEKKGQVKNIKLHRYMDYDEVKDEILDAFKWVRSYRVLDTTGGGHYLEVAKDQDLDGDGHC